MYDDEEATAVTQEDRKGKRKASVELDEDALDFWHTYFTLDKNFFFEIWPLSDVKMNCVILMFCRQQSSFATGAMTEVIELRQRADLLLLGDYTWNMRFSARAQLELSQSPMVAGYTNGVHNIKLDAHIPKARTHNGWGLYEKLAGAQKKNFYSIRYFIFTLGKTDANEPTRPWCNDFEYLKFLFRPTFPLFLRSPWCEIEAWYVPQEDFPLKEDARSLDYQTVQQLYSVFGYWRHMNSWRGVICKEIGEGPVLGCPARMEVALKPDLGNKVRLKRTGPYLKTSCIQSYPRWER